MKLSGPDNCFCGGTDVSNREKANGHRTIDLPQRGNEDEGEKCKKRTPLLSMQFKCANVAAIAAEWS